MDIINTFTVAILVISTTASKDPTKDSSIDVLRKVFLSQSIRDWEVVYTKIVGDDKLDIQQSIKIWSDTKIAPNLIVTTGGTGFAIKDITPEALTPLIDKHAPGLVHGMLATSFSKTHFALLSRPVAGIRKKSLIISLPGSPKGAKENLQSIIDILPHACQQAAGANSRALHAGGIEMLEQEAGITSLNIEAHPVDNNLCYRIDNPASDLSTSCSKNHLSNDQNLGLTYRKRHSPYPMISVADALKIIKKHSLSQKPIKVPINADIIGYVLAEDVIATEAVPAYRASIVDGYAISLPSRIASTKGVFTVLPASNSSELLNDNVKRITTGAPLPLGANAVVMVEDTLLRTLSKDGCEEKEVEILTTKLKIGENIREIGSDIEIGEILLRAGDEISTTGGELGLLASSGKSHVSVYAKPVIGVLSTGDELVEYNELRSLRLGEVRDCNRITIIAAARKRGFHVVDLGIVKDKLSDLEQVLKKALREVDVIITSGGVSMGEHDLMKSTIERVLEGTIHFGRVSMKPGKPTTFATIPIIDDVGAWDKKLIFSLPGNPVSALITFHTLVLPALEQTSGLLLPGLPKVTVTLDHHVELDPQRTEFHRAEITLGQDGLLRARSTGGQRSSRISSMRKANGLLILHAGVGNLVKGEKVDALLIGKLG